MAEIKISWTASPQGQVGTRPQHINLNEKCRFVCADPGDLTIEFVDRTPLGSTKQIDKNKDFIASTPGKFPFACIFTPPGGKPIRLDPPGGGEIEIGT